VYSDNSRGFKIQLSQSAKMTDISAVELSIFASRVAAISDEMGATLGCTALSPNIRDRQDYSCALFDRQGRLLGQATHIPVHLGSMAYAMADLVRQMDWLAGDMVILNDPYMGGTHLPDVTMIAPVFTDSNLVGFVANRAHYADIGADSPGSMPLATRLEDEGLLIKPVRLIKAGTIDDQHWQWIAGHLRNPELSLADLQAQIASNQRGVARFRDLLNAMGEAEFDRRCEALQDYARHLAAASLGRIPVGVYRFTDYLDDDGQGQMDIPICVRIEIDNSKIKVDFSGTSSQVAGNVNCPMSVTAAAVYYVFRCLLPGQIPNCAGALESISMSAEPGSLVNACHPAAVAAGNVETSMRLVDVLCGALAAALPELIPAAGQGTMNNIAMGSSDGDGWDYYETLGGGSGGGARHPGLSGRQVHMTNTLNTPIEVLERNYPLRILRYGLRPGSGGRGQNPGGQGQVRELEFLSATQVCLLTERRRRPPWGLNGGAPGQTGCNQLDGAELPAKCEFEAAAGQRLLIETPGGGGWGAV